MANYILIGRIARTKGYKGEVGIKVKLDDPYILTEHNTIYLERNKKYIPYIIDKIKITPKGHANVFLDDVDGEMAQILVGNDVFLPREILEEYDESSVLFQDVIGYQVTDTNYGELGDVSNVIEHPGNILLVIDYNGTEVFIPMIDAFVKNINHDTKKIIVETPEGLIELNG